MAIAGTKKYTYGDVSAGLNTWEDANDIADNEQSVRDGWISEGTHARNAYAPGLLITCTGATGSIQGVAYNEEDSKVYAVNAGNLYIDGVKQYTTATITVSAVQNETEYSFVVNGTTVAYTSDSNATEAEILAGLKYEAGLLTITGTPTFTVYDQVAKDENTATVGSLLAITQVGASPAVGSESVNLESRDFPATLPSGKPVSVRNYGAFTLFLTGADPMWAWDGHKLFRPLQWIPNTMFPLCCGFFEGKMLLGWLTSADGTAQPNILYSSMALEAGNKYKIFDFSAYPSSFVAIGGWASIVAIEDTVDYCYVFKKDEATYKLIGSFDDGSKFSYQHRKSAHHSCRTQFQVAKAGQELFYYDDLNSSIRAISLEEASGELKDNEISLPVRKDILAIKDRPTSAWSGRPFLTYSYPYLRLFYSAASTNYADYTLCYDVRNKSWGKVSLCGVQAVCSEEHVVGSSAIYSLKSTASRVPSSEFRTKHIDLGNPVSTKVFGGLELHGGTPTATGATLYVDTYFDGTLKRTYQIPYGDPEFTKRWQFRETCKDMSIGFRTSGTGATASDGFRISTFSIDAKPTRLYANVG